MGSKVFYHDVTAFVTAELPWACLFTAPQLLSFRSFSLYSLYFLRNTRCINAKDGKGKRSREEVGQTYTQKNNDNNNKTEKVCAIFSCAFPLAFTSFQPMTREEHRGVAVGRN